jgi:type I restriction enzyme, R subunit
MKSNFEFLAGTWNDLYEIAKSAEKCVLTEPNTTLIKLRLYSELITKYLFTYEELNESYRMNQKERIEFLLKKDIVSDEIFNILDTLRIRGNKAVHEANYGPFMETKHLLRRAFYLGGWFNQLYAQWDYEIPEYNEPQPNMEKLNNNNSKTAEKSVGTTSKKKPFDLPIGNIMIFSK